MAASLLKEISNDFLECQICLQPFHAPKILPCLHTFCKECLAEYTKAHSVEDDQIECPTCRCKSPLPSGNVDGLKNNFFVESLKDTVNLHKTLHSEGQGIVCSDPYCDSKGPAASRCLNCDELLCDECVAAHLRIKVTRDHTVLGLDELRGEGQALSVRNGQQHTCSEHTDEVVKFFCETCQVPMCRHCALLKHREHSFTHLKEHSALVRAEVQGQIDKVKSKTIVYRVIRFKLQNQIEEEKQAEKVIDQQIVDTASKLKKIIISEVDREKESLRVENRKISAFRQKLLLSEKDDAGSKLAYLGSTVEFAENLLSYGSDYQITVVGSDTKKRLEILEAESVPSIGQMPPRTFDENTKTPSFTLGSVHGDIKECELKLPCGHPCGDAHLVGRCKTSCLAQIKLKCGHLLGPCYEVGNVDVNKISCPKGHQIFVQLQSEEKGPYTISVNDVSLVDSVASIKKRCRVKVGKGNAALKFVFAGKTLRDDLKLEDYGVGFQSTIFLNM
ncbi:E3 ubiquitin-protein ligase TRIM56-like [Branchiostoma floridae]|uniref:E3 ubiquitin-protein ligase TRIM56-like n=1 Tax=Branchiostoma floridae TaxID=7739 RepID=A0A9J7LUQ8_BRAFL|nr:E3 ubiquitin-protein ligase TRIM56-like [Branchiostoma floridae]